MKPLIAITGGTGFLGHHVTKKLLERGFRLRLLVRSKPKIDLGNTQSSLASLELVYGDLTDSKALDELVVDADIILNMAGLIKASRREDFDAVNVRGTETLVRATREGAKQAKFIFVSSMAAREPSLSAYAASKAKAEDIVSHHLKDALIVRPSAIYGPGDKETLFFFKAGQFYFQPVLNTQAARLCLVHVADVTEAISASIEHMTNDKPLFGTYEITDERLDGYSWRELVHEICEATGSTARPFTIPSLLLKALGRMGSVHAALTGSVQMLSADKVNELLHLDWSSSKQAHLPRNIWRPRQKLREGFEETARWYRDQNWLS